MSGKHLADTPSVGTCPRELGECPGSVLALEFGRWYGRALWADDRVPCPEHSPERYARRSFHGASHKGRRRWWKR